MIPIYSTSLKLTIQILITHKLDFIKDCDKIMVLDKGSIVEFDSRQVLLDKDMLHKHTYTFQ
jgi:ABC-type multidrug transport system fused ATPase/permease subunit